MKVNIGPYRKTKDQKIKVKIDEYDVWSLDSTLAHIIYPALKKLKKIKHGSPCVDDCDVPDRIKSTSAPPVDEYETDKNFHKRWTYVLNAMIWSFKHKVKDTCFECKYHNKETDTYDWDKAKVKWDRMQKGFILFGKYYGGLWD